MRHNENGTQPADKTKKTPQKKAERKKYLPRNCRALQENGKSKAKQQTNRTADSAKKKNSLG